MEGVGMENDVSGNTYIEDGTDRNNYIIEDITGRSNCIVESFHWLKTTSNKTSRQTLPVGVTVLWRTFDGTRETHSFRTQTGVSRGPHTVQHND